MVLDITNSSMEFLDTQKVIEVNSHFHLNKLKEFVKEQNIENI